MQKTVYQADFNGLYQCPVTANELALAPGVFNIPYGAYEEVPPTPPEAKWPRRLGNVWILVDDYRTTPLWVVETGAPYVVDSEQEGAGGNVSYPGWGALPAWLTTAAPGPSALV